MTSFGKGQKKTKKADAGSDQILAWEDDPYSPTQSTAQPILRPKPNLASKLLTITINEDPPPVQTYEVGTREFRYWAAAEALQRGLDFWSEFLGGRVWQTQHGLALQVWLDDESPELNAYYSRCALYPCYPHCTGHCKLDPKKNDPCDTDRFGLSFFHDTINNKGITVYSGESPDVVCHELGHAVLDALQPELYCAQSVEVAAFHESFADISAILSALQLPTLRQSVLDETGGTLYQSSRLSRLAEQLGWGLRQRYPDSVEQDCLRNAVNSFLYRDPQTLAPSDPFYVLSSEPHSFSRVFTAAIFEALDGMLWLEASNHSSPPTEADLLTVSKRMGRLLVDAVLAEESSIYYFRQVARHMINVDANRFKRKYCQALKDAFKKRGILSLEAIKEFDCTKASKPIRPKVSQSARSAAATLAPSIAVDKELMAASTSLTRVALPGARYGFGNTQLLVNVPRNINSPGAIAEAIPPGSLSLPTREEETERAREAAARTFVDGLFISGKVDGGDRAPITHSFVRKTHKLVEEPEGLTLVRILFE